MQALLDAWVVGSPARTQSSSENRRRPLSQRPDAQGGGKDNESRAKRDAAAPHTSSQAKSSTWLGMLGESSLVPEGSWLDRNVVKPLAGENGSERNSQSSQDVSAGRTVRGRSEKASAGREYEDRPYSATPSSGHRSGAMTDRYGSGQRDRRGAPASERGIDLVQHLRHLESTLRTRGNETSSHVDSRTDRPRQKEKSVGRESERDKQRDKYKSRDRVPSEKGSKDTTPTLAYRLATPRNTSSGYTQGLGHSRPQSEASSRAGLLASPRAPLGYGPGPLSPGTAGSVVPRAGGALQGFNLYSNTDDSASSSESETSNRDETDASTLSFVSNGERIWRSPEGIFSRRGFGGEGKRSHSADPGKSRRISNTPVSDSAQVTAESKGAGKRDSTGADSNRSSGGPDIPRLNFANMFHDQEDPQSRGSSRPETPVMGAGMSSNVTPQPPEPLPSARQSVTKNSDGKQSLDEGSRLASPRGASQHQKPTDSALLRMYESLKAEHDALKAYHKSTTEQNESLRVSVLALERTLETKSAAGVPGLTGWLSARGNSNDSKCPSCSTFQRELESTRLELARERTRRRGIEQEKDKLEQMLRLATQGGAGSYSSARSGSKPTTPRGAMASPRGLPGNESLRGNVTPRDMNAPRWT